MAGCGGNATILYGGSLPQDCWVSLSDGWSVCHRVFLCLLVKMRLSARADALATPVARPEIKQQLRNYVFDEASHRCRQHEDHESAKARKRQLVFVLSCFRDPLGFAKGLI